jgi:hypothetical protein
MTTREHTRSNTVSVIPTEVGTQTSLGPGLRRDIDGELSNDEREMTDQGWEHWDRWIEVRREDRRTRVQSID